MKSNFFRWVWALNAALALGVVWIQYWRDQFILPVVIALLVIAGFCAWLAVRGPDDGPRPQRPPKV